MTWVVRFDHHHGAGESDATASAIAEIVNRPCFASCTRLNWGRGERWSGHRKKTPQAVREYLRDPQNETIRLDSGRQGELTCNMRFATGGARPPDATLSSFVVVPWTDDQPAREAAACDLARTLQAIVGAMAVFPAYSWAERFGYTGNMMEHRARELGLSELRHREWQAWASSRLARETEIAGPEWGLFLGPGHLAKLSPATLRASNAFAEVRELGEGRAFLRLTDDPRDALAPDYESRLDRARDALRPILADPKPLF